MHKFVFIIANKKTIISTFRIDSICSSEFELIFRVQLSKNEKLHLLSIENNERIVKNINGRIKYYLAKRNNENPDYYIDWKGRFDKNQMFLEENVIGIKMDLFQGNEGLIISF